MEKDTNRAKLARDARLLRRLGLDFSARAAEAEDLDSLESAFALHAAVAWASASVRFLEGGEALRTRDESRALHAITAAINHAPRVAAGA